MEYEITAWIPAHIRDSLRPGMTGEIVLVSSTGVYLKLGEQIVLLCDRNWGVLPIGIGIENFDRAVCLLRPQQGQQVRILEHTLLFQTGEILLVPQDPFRERMRSAAPKIKSILQAARELAALHKERGISILVQPLVLGRQPEQPLKRNPYCACAYPYLSRLMTALDDGDSDEIHSCVEKLLGLGPGLTPSADDCLLGMLYVFRALPREAPAGSEMLRKCIVQVCDQYTNQISSAYLKAIIAGAPFERMELVFRGVCGEGILDIEELTQIGSSSGSEMLLGMLIALKLCGYDVAQREELTMREQIVQKVLEKKIVAIVRGVYGEDCVKLAQALYDGGIELLEVTFDQSKPELLERTSDTIRQLTERLGDRMIFGAGTVTTLEMLELAKNAGARFIVSPDTNEAVIRATVESGMVSMPGALTPTEVVAAHAYGADFVKLFPAGSMGAGYLKAVRAPLNHVRLLAVGGVNEKNIADFLTAGAVGAGVGGNLVNKTWIKNGEFDKITAVAKEFVKNAGL